MPNAPAGGNHQHTGGWEATFDIDNLKHITIEQATDSQLCEWLATRKINLVFQKYFYQQGPLKGLVRGRSLHSVPRALIWIEELDENVGTLPMSTSKSSRHVRNAVRDTYPSAVTLHDLLIQDLKEAANPAPSSPSLSTTDSSESDSDSESSSDSDESDHNSLKKRKRAPTNKPAAASSTRTAPCQRSNYTKGSKAARFALCALLGFFGIKTNGCSTRGVFHKPSRLNMHDDSTGAAGVALFAAMHAYQAAKEGEFSLSFLPPEQRSQKDARKRPNKDQWMAAEDKELNTLWKMEAFEVVDLPDDYDPPPLQFVYKLKIKDGDFDNCIYKARLVARGDLQYVTENGSTYAPTARLSTIRALTAIAAQQGHTLKKFDLTGAFLVADMDRPLFVKIPGYSVEPGKAILLCKALTEARAAARFTLRRSTPG